MIAAYVAGYEAWAELSRRDPGHHHRKGWHPTGIFGAIAAAAACARLRRLDAEQGDDGAGAGGVASRRADGQFRHDDQAVPRRPGGACRAGLGAAWPRPGSPPRPTRSSTRRGSCPRCRPRASADRDSPARAAASRGTSSRTGSASRNTRPATALHRSLDGMLDLLDEAAAAAGRDRPHHRLDQQDAGADPAQPPAADRARRQVQHGIRDGRRGHRAPRQPRRVHRRLCPPPRRAGADAEGRDRDQRKLRPRSARAPRSSTRCGSSWSAARRSRARRCGAPAAPPSCRCAMASCSRNSAPASTPAGARIAPEVLFGRLKNLERLSARELTAVG